MVYPFSEEGYKKEQQSRWKKYGLVGQPKESRSQSPQLATDNAQQMLNGKYDPNQIETIQYYRHTEVWDGLCDYKELPTNLPFVSHVQTL